MNKIHLQTMLADYAATTADGKVTIVGGGWSVTGPAPTPSALVFVAKVPWDRANETNLLVAELVDEDHVPWRPADAPEEFQSIRVELPMEVGRPAGVLAGSDLDWSAAVNIGPLPLTPGKRFVWSVFLNDETEDG